MNGENDQNTGHRIFRGTSQQYGNEEGEFPVYNILLLGETGAGKSTTINAFANYMKYGDFDTAKENRFVQMIPSKFTLPDPEGKGEPIMIHSGIEDENEQAGSGASSTKAPVAYTFRFKDRTLRIIDTPGMGDTNGLNVDRENFDQILAHLNNYKQLHGILLLLKATETRKNAFFRYCITELLTYLHRSACNNLVFCYTFSRNSFYGPGEGFTTLKSFLRGELKDVPLTLEVGENCFFIDNEAYRFLVAQKQGYTFKVEQEASYKESWNNSAEQCDQMWDRITRTVPHNLESTISLNNARKLILEIAEPMVLLQTMIQSNITQIENKNNLIKNSSEDIEELVKQLYLDVDDLKAEPLDYPRTVCTSASCTEVIKVEGVDKVHYKTLCHPHCYLDDVGINTVGDPSLKNCSAMEGRPVCTLCACDWQKHMHIKTEFTKVKRPIIDKGKEGEIKTKEDAVKVVDEAIKQMEDLIKDYENELQVIKEICTKFAVLLVTNSNIAYNKFIDPYLDLLMDEEIKKVNSVPGYSKSTHESLQRMKDTHRQSVKIMEDAINSNQQDQVQLRDIFKYKDTLFGLKQTGAQFRQIMDTGSFAKKKSFDSIPEKSLDLRNVTHSNNSNNQNNQNNNDGNNNNNNQRENGNFWGQFRFW